MPKKTGAPIGILRLPGVFGKWCRPNYNSVVATFCHNIAHGLPITISDPAIGLDVIHIDDVVKCILDTLAGESRVGSDGFFHAEPQFHISLGDLARKLRDFHADRQTLIVPDLSDHFTRCLYSTYVSYLPADGFSHALERREDARGALAEILKSRSFGQIFISRTRPGVERGNHYHDTKVEKFAVLDGEAVIRFRDIRGDEMIEYPVSGQEFKVLDIPPGYTHSIENVGSTELIVLFWAYEPYDPGRPDTFPLPVRKERTP